MLNAILTQVSHGGPVRIVIKSRWIQSRVFYLVFPLVAFEPDLSKVQQQHLFFDLQGFLMIEYFNLPDSKIRD